MDALLLEHGGRTYITGHANIVTPVAGEDTASWAQEHATSNHPGFLWVAGKFVEADKPNLNKQFWSTADLEFGQFTVQYTPMNLLHKIYEPIGVYTAAKLFPGTEAANTHIQALGCLWAHRYPTEAALVEMANAANTLFYSMECVGEKLHCKGGCEKEFDYFSNKEDLCSHLQERTSVRHIVNPYFTGGAIIVPPSQPAWPNAEVEVIEATASFAKEMDDAADLAHSQDDSLSPTQWRYLMNMVLGTANRRL